MARPKSLRREFYKNRYVYLFLLPTVVYYLLFHYIPMGGAVIAFQNFKPTLGYLGSKWVGLEHFKSFLSSPFAWRLIRNTLLINIYAIVFGFPAPILFALILNEIQCAPLKKACQTVSYMPHFISLVVICGMIVDFSRTNGLFNDMLAAFGLERTNLLARPELFRGMYTVSGIWQSMGWGSILYLATLSGVDPSLHEAAAIDGASRLRRIIHVSIPALMPVIIIQLIMRLGNIMSQGYEKIILLYGPVTYDTADVVSSYVYRRGLEQGDFSFGAAVGIFNSAINVIILALVNETFRRTTQESLW